MMNLKEKLHKFRDLFLLIVERASEADINSTSITIAYYALLAILPTIILLGNILSIINLKEADVLNGLQVIVPSNVFTTLKPIIETMLKKGSGGIASVSGILALWAVSRGINALKNGLNMAYGVGKGTGKGAVLGRIFSIFITVVLGLLIVALFLVFSFGQIALDYITPLLNLSTNWIDLFMRWKWPTSAIGIFVIIILIYTLIPNAKLHFILVLPGAILATIGWLGLSQGFSIYVRYFTRTLLSYEALGTFIVLLLWLNYTGWVIMLGSVVNAGLEYYFFGEVKTKSSTIRKIFQ